MCALWFAQVSRCQGVHLHLPVCTATWGSLVNMCVRVCACVHACICVCCCSSWWLKACFLPDIISHVPQNPGTCSGEYFPLSQ